MSTNIDPQPIHTLPQLFLASTVENWITLVTVLLPVTPTLTLTL